MHKSIATKSNKPFEGILGDSTELRIIQFMLPLDGIAYSSQELAENIQSSVRETNIALDKLCLWGIMKRINQNTFEVSKESPLIESINNFNNVMIGMIIEEIERKKKCQD